MAAWNCHCSHCRASTAKDPDCKGEYSFNSADFWCNVKVTGPTKGTCTTYAPCGCPCPIWGANRRQCAHCDQPLVYWGHGALTGFAVVNCQAIKRTVDDPSQLPDPKFENFYDSGLKKGQTSEKTYYGDACSTLGLMYQLLCCGLPPYVCCSTGSCCCCGWDTNATAPAP